MIDVIPIIKEKMKIKSLTAKDLHGIIGGSYPNLLNSLSGKKGMNLATFLKIAEVLDIKLFGEERDNPEREQEFNRLKEDNENLRALANYLRKEKEEIEAELKRVRGE